MTSLGKEYIVYRATNVADPNKIYIGVTAKSLDERKYRHFYFANRGSKLHFHRALKKHGQDGFVWDIINICKSYKDAFDIEMSLIAELRKTKNLYNMTSGGDGVRGNIVSKETRLKMSLAKIGKPNHWSGGKMPQELRDRLAALRRSENRILTEKNRRALRINAKKANAVRRRPIICLNDDMYYLSVVAAATAYGLTSGQISYYCRETHKNRSGLQFGYARDEI